MNHVVAYELLSTELANYRELPYEELSYLVGVPLSRLVHRDGVDYDITSTVRRLKKSGGDIDLEVTVRDANWGSPHDPVSETVVISRPLLRNGNATEKDFWLSLEFRLGLEFRHMADGDLTNHWCDGIAPSAYFLDEQRPRILGYAWICGDSSYEEWKFELLLSHRAERPQDIDWASLLPADNVTRWLAVDEDAKFIQIEPAAAVPDLK